MLILGGMVQGVVGQKIFDGGSGTAADPYLVNTARQLDSVRYYLNSYFLQTANINLDVNPYNTGSGWDPIGTDEAGKRFRGVYDSGAFEISNLYIDRSGTSNVGLFGCLDQGTQAAPVVIRRVKLRGTVKVVGARGTGSLAGRVRGNIYTLIEGCSVVGNTDSYVRGNGATGGLVGANNSLQEQPGGEDNPIISQSYANIPVEATDGGGGDKIGGLVGCNQKGTTINSYALGAVTVVGTTAFQRVGGLAGCTDLRGRITNSYSTGKVTPNQHISTTLIGGLVGHLGSGGVGNRGTVTSSYWLQGAYDDSAGGTMLTDAQMKQSSSFSGWNFSGIWSITEGSSYPLLGDLTSTNYVVWQGTTADWDMSSNWSPNRVPVAGDLAIIPSGQTKYPVITTAITVPAISVNVSTGGNITINPVGQLTVQGSMSNASGNLSGIIIESSGEGTGSLIHTTTDVQGTIQRYIPKAGYHQVSVPLTAAGNPTSNLFKWSYLYQYNASTQQWNPLGTPTGTPLNVNQGYLSYKYSSEPLWKPDTTYSFAGAMNNGNFTPDVIYNSNGGFNLVPNPYPSAIDWNAASGWTRTNIANSYWMWIHSANNYGVWNGTGTHGVTKDIPVGQAFFVQAAAAEPVLSFNNQVRLHSSQSFYKSAEETLPALRVAAVSAGGRDESVLMFCDSKTDAVFDPMLDAQKMFGGQTAPQLYWLSGDQHPVSIFRHPHPTKNISIMLGFEMGVAGEVEMRFEGVGNLSLEGSVWLEDLKTGQMTDLLQEDVYAFDHDTGNDAERFVLHVTTETPSGVPGRQELPFHLLYATERQIHASVPSLAGQPAEAEVFDMLGRSVQRQEIVLTAGTTALPPLLPGAYVVRLVTGNQVFTGRVVVK